IGSVAGDAGIDHSILWQRFLQKVAETFVRFGVIAIGERVAEKEESIWRDTAQLSLAQSKAVVPHRNRTIAARLLGGGVWHGDPAELRIKLESLAKFEAAWPADIDDAKQKFGSKKYRDNDRAQYKQSAQPQAAAAAPCRHISQRLLHGHRTLSLIRAQMGSASGNRRQSCWDIGGCAARISAPLNPARTRPDNCAARPDPARP